LGLGLYCTPVNKIGESVIIVGFRNPHSTYIDNQMMILRLRSLAYDDHKQENLGYDLHRLESGEV
jgi:hypothetical protein